MWLMDDGKYGKKKDGNWKGVAGKERTYRVDVIRKVSIAAGLGERLGTTTGCTFLTRGGRKGGKPISHVSLGDLLIDFPFVEGCLWIISYSVDIIP